MSNSIIKLDVDDPIATWHNLLFTQLDKNDFVISCDNKHMTRWFITNYCQHLCKMGGCEVVPLYGNLIHNLDTFCYQINYGLPVGYKMKSDFHALYDLLLNFETEPPTRVIIWNDAQFLFNTDPGLFAEIFELMTVTAYCHRMGISTIKEDGTRYQVDQRNLFMFEGPIPAAMANLLNKEYRIPSWDNPELRTRLPFNVIELTEYPEEDAAGRLHYSLPGL
jgi:hypothetical protein